MLKITLGVHTSIAGGLHLSIARAKELGCNTVQIFSHNPRQWHIKNINDKEISEFKRLRQLYDINPVFIHASYLINLCSFDEGIYNKSSNLLYSELKIADLLGADYVVLHLGSALENSHPVAQERATSALKKVSDMDNFHSKILVENTAGKKGDISNSIKNLAEIIDCDYAGIIGGVCLDTSHAFAAGYNLKHKNGLLSLVDEIDKFLGRDNIKLIHLNDSKKDYNSKVDRHEHIGKGYIGIQSMKNFLKHPAFKSKPIILETPKERKDDDSRNLELVRALFQSKRKKLVF